MQIRVGDMLCLGTAVKLLIFKNKSLDLTVHYITIRRKPPTLAAPDPTAFLRTGGAALGRVFLLLLLASPPSAVSAICLWWQAIHSWPTFKKLLTDFFPDGLRHFNYLINYLWIILYMHVCDGVALSRNQILQLYSRHTSVLMLQCRRCLSTFKRPHMYTVWWLIDLQTPTLGSRLSLTDRYCY